MLSRKIHIINSEGIQELFDEKKLELSLLRSGASHDSVSKVLEHIDGELRDGLTTAEIYSHAFDVLKSLERPVAARYSLRRSVLDIGPTGFPFEKLIAQIFEKKGYITKTGTMIQGRCAEHEIDVLCLKDELVEAVEAKFHNSIGEKSDLKVALYVKARFDDIKGVKISVGENSGKINKMILVTNTKFTSNAIEYGTCAGIEMISWNYPHKNNLLSLVEKNHLHPLTCLTTLESGEKRILLDKGVVLIDSLKDGKHLKDLGIKDARIDDIISEIESIIFSSGNQEEID